jgi:hyperosmotically inducible protein
MTDADLEKSVRARLDTDPRLKAAGLSISADATENEVTLSGTVESNELRNKAVELARSTQTGLLVTDTIEVKPREMSRADYTEEKAREAREKAAGYGERIGDSIDDAWIHTKIVAKLIGDPDTPKRKINVDVVDNVVTLRGTVATMNEKTEAGRIARETDGVRSVKNLLKVNPASA